MGTPKGNKPSAGDGGGRKPLMKEIVVRDKGGRVDWEATKDYPMEKENRRKLRAEATRQHKGWIPQ